MTRNLLDWLVRPGSFYRNWALFMLSVCALPAFVVAIGDRHPLMAFAETLLAWALFYAMNFGSIAAGIFVGMRAARVNAVVGWTVGVVVTLLIGLAIMFAAHKIPGVEQRFDKIIDLGSAEAAQNRSNAVRHAFAREHPCPSTGRPRLPCPGYIIDHIEPLCAGGADHVSNLQWQTVADAKIKDREEKRQCRAMRRQ